MAAPKKRLRGLHIRLGAPYKSVALGRIRCFCLSQAARDVQQVKETTTGSAEVASSSSGAKEQLQEGTKEQQRRESFFIVLFSDESFCNRFI